MNEVEIIYEIERTKDIMRKSGMHIFPPPISPDDPEIDELMKMTPLEILDEIKCKRKFHGMRQFLLTRFDRI